MKIAYISHHNMLKKKGGWVSEWVSEWVSDWRQLSHFAVISWREQVNCECDDDNLCFVLN
jgi:hypothetical protein